MDPHSFIARAEAQRWLGIAEKLLIGHDLVGSKTFAIRARESDPRLEAADQILAIIDTLLAADKQLVGNNGTQHPDFYAILQLVQFVQDPDHIASQYRRLSMILNPNHNRYPYSDQAFQLVNDAWAVLSNPLRKSIYDSELDFPQQQQQQQQMNTLGFNLDHQQHHQQQHQHNFFSINRVRSGNEQELHEPQQMFQVRANHQQQQLQQHNFLSQNPVRSVPVHENEQLFQHHEPEQLFQPQVQPFQVTSASQQQTRLPPQPPMQPPNPPPPAAPPQPPLSWPQAPPQVNINNGAREEETETETEAEIETETADENVDDSPTFWTTCPYCFYMYEYPRVYADCTLRCDNCKRAFQAICISSPPPTIDGQDAYYYCWGFFPIGVSMSHLQKNNGTTHTNSNWTPFSPLYDVSSNVQDHLNEMAAPKKNYFVNKNLGPRIYIDDVTDDIFMGISEPSEDSDFEWNSTSKKKAKKMKKGYRKRAQVLAVRVRDARNVELPTASVAEGSKKGVGSNRRRQSGRTAKELGKLDLNVEFDNNESDETATRMNSGNGQGEEDNIEGIGFFEGLDDFLSNLPILSVVKDEKVKAG